MYDMNFSKMYDYSVLYVFLMLFSSSSLMAQTVAPQIGTIMHKDGLRSCLVVNLAPAPKEVKEAWSDYLKDNHEVKLKGIGFLQNRDLLSAKEIVFESISNKKMDFYTEIKENENGSEMKVFASYGYDIYVNKQTEPEEFAKMNTIIDSFLQTYLPNYYNELIENSIDRIDDLADDVDDLQGDISGDEESIQDLQKQIEAMKQELEDKKKSLESAERKLLSRKQELDRINSQIDKM